MPFDRNQIAQMMMMQGHGGMGGAMGRPGGFPQRGALPSWMTGGGGPQTLPPQGGGAPPVQPGATGGGMTPPPGAVATPTIDKGPMQNAMAAQGGGLFNPAGGSMGTPPPAGGAMNNPYFRNMMGASPMTGSAPSPPPGAVATPTIDKGPMQAAMAAQGGGLFNPAGGSMGTPPPQGFAMSNPNMRALVSSPPPQQLAPGVAMQPTSSLAGGGGTKAASPQPPPVG